MEKVYDKCCGVDVHKKLMVACFLHGREKEIREFGATTREPLELAQWLSDGDCEMVAMEAQLLTGSHYIMYLNPLTFQQWLLMPET